jgi:membrane protein implicated in regulation of membrane protease activity
VGFSDRLSSGGLQLFVYGPLGRACLPLGVPAPAVYSTVFIQGTAVAASGPNLGKMAIWSRGLSVAVVSPALGLVLRVQTAMVSRSPMNLTQGSQRRIGLAEKVVSPAHRYPLGV